MNNLFIRLSSYIDTKLEEVTDYVDEIAENVDDLNNRVSDLEIDRVTESSNTNEIVNLVCNELREKKPHSKCPTCEQSRVKLPASLEIVHENRSGSEFYFCVQTNCRRR